jgi:hypothetical protein
MRYQIADGILDYVHVFWIGFFLLPLGTIAMGPASIFAPVRNTIPPELCALGMGLLAGVPYVAVRAGQLWAYALARAGSAGFYATLGVLCVRSRPYSTGMIYWVLGIAALLLLLDACWHGSRWRVGREEARVGERAER